MAGVATIQKWRRCPDCGIRRGLIRVGCEHGDAMESQSLDTGPCLGRRRAPTSCSALLLIDHWDSECFGQSALKLGCQARFRGFLVATGRRRSRAIPV
jgi:hypothetical protein